MCCYFFFFNDTATTEIYTLSLHDALPISVAPPFDRTGCGRGLMSRLNKSGFGLRSEEHTSELQSQSNLVCRLLLEKKKKRQQNKQFIESRESQTDPVTKELRTPHLSVSHT